MSLILPKIDLFTNPYHIYSYREPTDKEIMDNPQLLYGEGVKDKIIKTLSTSKDVVKHIVEKMGDNKYENYLLDKLAEDEKFEQWDPLKDFSKGCELDLYQNARSCNFPKLNDEIKSYDCFLEKGQRVFRGCFGDISQKNIIESTPISTTLFPTVAYNEIIRNIKKDEDRIIFDLVVDNSKTNVFYYGSNTGFHSNEKEVLFAFGARIQIIGDYEKIGEIDTHLGKRPLYYAAGIIT